MSGLRPIEQMSDAAPAGSISYDSDKPSREEKLDEVVSKAEEAAAARQAEREDFDKSREARASLASRYGREEASTEKIISRFLGMHHEFQKNPDRAADDLASSYLRSYNAKNDRENQKSAHGNSALPVDPSESSLDAAIARAMSDIEVNRREDQEFEGTHEQRAELKKIFPHLSFAEAMESISHLDRSLMNDPVGAAARIAASYGAPVTPGQQMQTQAAQAESSAVSTHESLIGEMEVAGELPNLPAPEGEMVRIMSEPNFPWTGHPKADLRNAHAEATRRTVLAAQAEASRRETIEKARRAAPIKTSSGYSAASSTEETDLDSIISRAIG